MKSEVLERIHREMELDPWHVKLRRWWRVKNWFWAAKRRHYKNWIFSKQYRLSYGDCPNIGKCTAMDKDYCDNNPKCNLRKMNESYIEV